MVPPQTGGILLFTIGASQGNSILFRVGKDLHVGDRQDRHELERPRVSGPGCCWVWRELRMGSRGFDYFDPDFQISRFPFTHALAGKLHRGTTSSTTKLFPREIRSASSCVLAVRIS